MDSSGVSAAAGLLAGTPVHSPVISVTHRLSLGGVLSQVAATSPTAWPTANRAIFVPFGVEYPFVAQGIAWLNGNVASGNVDAGIYDRAGNRLVSSGSTAQGTVNVIQSVALTPTVLTPGQYYMALAFDNVTATTGSRLFGVPSAGAAFAVQQMASAFVLPSTATFAVSAFTGVPIMGVMQVATI